MNDYLVNDLFNFHNASGNGTFRLWDERIDFYDLTIVLKGELVYTVNDQKYVLKKNDIMLLPPGTLRARQEQSGYIHYVSFNFSLLPDISLPLENFMPNAASDDIKKILSLINQEYISTYYHSKEKCTNLLNCILFELLNKFTFNSDNSHVNNMLKYIEENITKKLTLQGLSQEIGLTKEYTAYIFKKSKGCTVTEYINERKMLLAKELITYENMSLAELSSHLGYDNYTYFSRLFKRYFKISPSELRYKSKEK